VNVVPIRRFLALHADVRVVGMCDAGERDVFLCAGIERFGVFAADLEDELIPRARPGAHPGAAPPGATPPRSARSARVRGLRLGRRSNRVIDEGSRVGMAQSPPRAQHEAVTQTCKRSGTFSGWKCAAFTTGPT
jgi:hypothetical protein